MSSEVIPPRESPWARLGPALTTRNVWLWVAVFMVALSNLSTLPGDVRNPVLNLTGGAMAAGVAVLVVWLAWLAFLRHMSGAFRVALALAVIAVAGMARGAAYHWLLLTWGLTEPGPQGLTYRLFGGVVMAVAGALTGALVKVNIEAHRVRLEQLDALQAHLSQVLASSEGNLRSDQHSALGRIVDDLNFRLEDVRSSNPALAADSLERLTAEIVRPLSHELAASAPVWQAPAASSLVRQLDWAKVWAAMASPATINPLGPAIMMLVVIPSSAVHMGLRDALVLHGLVAGLIYLGLLLLRRTAGSVASGQPTAVRLVVTFLLMAVACLPAAVVAWLLSPEDSRWVSATYACVVIPIVGLLFSFIRSARWQQQAIDVELSALVEETQWWITRTGMVHWWQSAALARALHGPVQSAIYSAAVRLRAEPGNAEQNASKTQAVLKGVGEALTDIVLNGRRQERLCDEMAELRTSWQPLVEVAIDCPEAVVSKVDDDQVCAEVCMDIVAEAVSNAVRHGGARRVTITVGVDQPDALTVVVSDDGVGRSESDQHGLGTAQLDACALDWMYERVGEFNRLGVALPLLRPERSERSVVSVAASF